MNPGLLHAVNNKNPSIIKNRIAMISGSAGVSSQLEGKTKIEIGIMRMREQN